MQILKILKISTILKNLAIIGFLMLSLFTPVMLGHTAMAENTDSFKQQIIPKPTYLPGPTEEMQTESSEEDQIGIKRVFGTKILPNIIVMMIGMVGGLSLVFLIVAGVRFMTAYGNDEAVTKAKNQAMFAIIGFLLALFAYGIVAIVSNISFVDDTTQRTDTTSDEETTTDNIIDKPADGPSDDNIPDEPPDGPSDDNLID